MPRRTAAESRLTDLAELELAEPYTAVERWVREQDGWWLACGGTNAQSADAVVLSRRVAGADLGEQAQRLGQARVDGGREQEDGQEGGGHGGRVARGEDGVGRFPSWCLPEPWRPVPAARPAPGGDGVCPPLAQDRGTDGCRRLSWGARSGVLSIDDAREAEILQRVGQTSPRLPGSHRK